MSDCGWRPWQPVAGLPGITAAVLGEILDGGQAFRWYPVGDVWVGTFGSLIAALRVSAGGGVEWSAPFGSAADAVAPFTPVAPASAGTSDRGSAIARYLRADEPDPADALPWRSDAHLSRCMTAFPGLRILRQPFGETLLCFLCSATKQIVQIKQMVALLAQRHGAPIAGPAVLDLGPLLTAAGGSARAETASAAALLPAAPAVASLRYRLPTWDELAGVPERLLRDCLLGFRARYIAQTAQFLQQHPGWLEETEQLPYAQAKARLCDLPGVGEKVADCALLFGAGKGEAFPVDVWILKTLARRYQLEGWKPAQLAQFGRAHFGPHAGLAQQFLFSWERAEGKNGKGERLKG